ncbi:MAG: ferric reductase-like transmembrane domain-containing protein [Vicinamibacterales bacterium]
MVRVLPWIQQTCASVARSSWVATAAALAITTGLWGAGKGSGVSAAGLWPLRGAIQLSGLWAFTLFCMAIVAVGRTQAMEPVFGGFDRATVFHRIVGPAALFFTGIHVLLMVGLAVREEFPIASVLVPFAPGARTLDIIATYLLVALAVLAFSRRLRYERWLTLHRPMAVLFLVAAVNFTLFEAGTPRGFEPLRTWMILLMLGSGAALLYRVFLFKRFGNRYDYRVEDVVPRPDETLDLVMRPVSKRMMYEPGTFAFVRIPDHGRHANELHPFSISSTPVDRDLRISIKMVGDFTRSLTGLRPGTRIDVYGPFGGFTPHRFAQYRRLVFIGSGIGITPFLSMLAFEQTNRDFRRIWLYYLVRDREHAPYDDEIRASYLKADSFIDYELWDTATRKRLTAKQVMENVAPLDNYAVMLCGSPEFVADMTRQFHALGLPLDRIISEELRF